MTDPWLISSANEDIEIKSDLCVDEAQVHDTQLEFEDNFAPPSSRAAETDTNQHQPLPDSASYLRGLERKLQNLKQKSNLIEALGKKRHDCMRSLLEERSLPASTENNNEILELDTPVNHIDSTVQELYRHLQPMQPVTIGETVHIVKYDQLEQQQQDTEEVSTSEVTIENASP